MTALAHGSPMQLIAVSRGDFSARVRRYRQSPGAGVSGQGAAPETGGQSRIWERVKSNAVSAGMDDVCAAQLAWGVQNGFSTVRPPCGDCASIVATLPVGKANGWRVVVGSVSSPRNWVAWATGRDLIRAALDEGGEGTRELRRSSRVDEHLREREV